MAEFGEGLSEGFDWGAVEDYAEFKKVVQERFPAWAWALDHEVLGPIIAQAAEEEWSPDVFMAAIEESTWYNERNEAQREWDIYVESTPQVDIDQRYADEMDRIRDRAAALGISLPQGEMRALAEKSLRNAFDDRELTGYLMDVSTGITATGSIEALRTQIRGMADDYYVDLTDEQVADYANRITRGDVTMDMAMGNIRTMAKSRWPDAQLTEFIDNGGSLREYFTPHTNAIASSMGVAPEQVDLTSPEWRQVMSIRDRNGKLAPMTLDQVDRFVRTKDQFWKGQQGRNEMFDMQRTLLRHMGAIA